MLSSAANHKITLSREPKITGKKKKSAPIQFWQSKRKRVLKFSRVYQPNSRWKFINRLLLILAGDKSWKCQPNPIRSAPHQHRQRTAFARCQTLFHHKPLVIVPSSTASPASSTMSHSQMSRKQTRKTTFFGRDLRILRTSATQAWARTGMWRGICRRPCCSASGMAVEFRSGPSRLTVRPSRWCHGNMERWVFLDFPWNFLVLSEGIVKRF